VLGLGLGLGLGERYLIDTHIVLWILWYRAIALQYEEKLYKPAVRVMVRVLGFHGFRVLELWFRVRVSSLGLG